MDLYSSARSFHLLQVRFFSSEFVAGRVGICGTFCLELVQEMDQAWGIMDQSADRISGGLSGCSCASVLMMQRPFYLKVVKGHARSTEGHFSAPLRKIPVFTHQTFCVGESKVESRGHRLNV